MLKSLPSFITNIKYTSTPPELGGLQTLNSASLSAVFIYERNEFHLYVYIYIYIAAIKRTRSDLFIYLSHYRVTTARASHKKMLSSAWIFATKYIAPRVCVARFLTDVSRRFFPGDRKCAALWRGFPVSTRAYTIENIISQSHKI